jgi:hypothetical protein
MLIYVDDYIKLNNWLIECEEQNKKDYKSNSKTYQYYCIKLKHYKEDKIILNKFKNNGINEKANKDEVYLRLKTIMEVRKRILNDKLATMYKWRIKND